MGDRGTSPVIAGKVTATGDSQAVEGVASVECREAALPADALEEVVATIAARRVTCSGSVLTVMPRPATLADKLDILLETALMEEVPSEVMTIHASAITVGKVATFLVIALKEPQEVVTWVVQAMAGAILATSVVSLGILPESARATPAMIATEIVM